MAATSHQYVAVVLAVEGMFANVGGAVGETVASAIWTGVFPHRLREFLPQDMKSEWATIYEDLTEQLSYPIGSPTRTAIIEAYGVSPGIVLRRVVKLADEIALPGNSKINADRIHNRVGSRSSGCHCAVSRCLPVPFMSQIPAYRFTPPCTGVISTSRTTSRSRAESGEVVSDKCNRRQCTVHSLKCCIHRGSWSVDMRILGADHSTHII